MSAFKTVLGTVMILQCVGTTLAPSAQPTHAAQSRMPPYPRADASADFDAQDYEYCLTCHGSVGQGNPAVDAPVLAGIEPWYLLNQLSAFRVNWRGIHPDDLLGMEMHSAAKALRVNELPKVTAYIAALVPVTASIRVKPEAMGNATAGKLLYQACAACHGAGAEGQFNLQAPALAYQYDSYLVRQLRHFRDGVRGSAAGDTRGASMAAAAQGLSDDDIHNIVAYIRSLN